MGDKGAKKREFAYHLKHGEVPASIVRETVSKAVRESQVFTKVRQVLFDREAELMLLTYLCNLIGLLQEVPVD